MGMKRDV